MTWFHDKVENYEKHFAASNKDILVCPFDIPVDACSRITDSLNDIASIIGIITELIILSKNSTFFYFF